MINLFFLLDAADLFEVFQLVVKLVTAVSVYLAFRSYRWDVSNGLMGGVLFSLMCQEAYFALARLWGAGDFDTYLAIGVQGSLYPAAAGMTFLMTVTTTTTTIIINNNNNNNNNNNHFFTSYARHGNEKNVILGRVAITFKFAMYVLLLVTNGVLDLSQVTLWRNALQYLTDISLLVLIATLETQSDWFNATRHEMRVEMRGKGEGK